MKVSTYEGYKWINPDGEERFINKSFYAYNEASFNALKQTLEHYIIRRILELWMGHLMDG